MTKRMFTEMAKALLLSSTLVLSKKSIDNGFEFKYIKREEGYYQQLAKVWKIWSENHNEKWLDSKKRKGQPKLP